MPVEVTYPLIPSGSPDVGGGGGTTAPPSPGSGPLGIFGLLTPFRRGPADFVSGSGLPLLQSMISQVLGTRASTDYSTGELPWRGAFGSKLHFLRHRKNDPTTRELARVYTVEALARWLPQIRVIGVETQEKVGPQGQKSIALVLVRYHVVGQRGEIIARSQTANVSLRD